MAACLIVAALAALRPPPPAARARVVATAAAGLIPPAVDEVEEPAARDAASAVESVVLELPGRGSVRTSFICSGAAANDETPPLLLLHGFDSSCLEFRRLMPRLASLGLEAYAVDILGWGFTDTSLLAPASDRIGVAAKRAQLQAFCDVVLGGRPAVGIGASLGAAVLTDLAAAAPATLAKAVLLDPQSFIEGTPEIPGGELGARAGIRVLSSWPLRWAANQLAYSDKGAMATDDAIRVGLLHCGRNGWEDDQVEWLRGDGYAVADLVRPTFAEIPTLVLWGRDDQILPPADYLPNFVDALPSATFRFVDACGHVPHLEQPNAAAAAIGDFTRGEGVPGDDADVRALCDDARRKAEIVAMARGALEQAQASAGDVARRAYAALRPNGDDQN